MQTKGYSIEYPFFYLVNRNNFRIFRYELDM